MFAIDLPRLSSGLTGGGHDVVLHEYDPASGKKTAERTVVSYPDGKQRNFNMFGTPEGVVLEVTKPDQDSPEIEAFGLNGLQPLWTSSGMLYGAADGSVGVGQPNRTVFLNSRDGSQLAEYLTASGGIDFIPPAGTFYVYKPVSVSNFGYIMSYGTGELTRSGKTVTSGLVYVNGATGKPDGPGIVGANDITVDEFGPLLLAQFGSVNHVRYAVIDRRTGQQMLEVPQDLEFAGLALANGRLYISNTSDSPVVNATTGATEHAGWSNRPIARIGDSTLVASGPSTSPTATCGQEKRRLSPTVPSKFEDFMITGYFDCPTVTVVADIDDKFPGPHY